MNVKSINRLFTLYSISDHWDGGVDRVRPGHNRSTQQSGPFRPGALHCRPRGVGHRPVDGLQLWLRRQPSQGPRAARLHGSCRLGRGGFHVSLKQYASLTIDCDIIRVAQEMLLSSDVS